MKWLLASIFFLQLSSSNAQYIYVHASEPFHLLVSKQTQPQTAIWIKTTDLTKPITFKLESGRILSRIFPLADEDAKYEITANAIRYRPNMVVAKADTIAQPILQSLPQRDVSKMAGSSNTLNKIKALPYEFEKLEAVKRELQKPGLTCSYIIDLVNCLKYDAQKVEAINGIDDIPEDCEDQLRTTVSEAYQTLIK